MAANGSSADASISSDGRFVGWNSQATNVAAGIVDANPDNDPFQWDANVNTSSLIGHSIVTASTGASGQALGHTMTSDGRYIAFDSDARNLVPGETDTVFTNDVYIWDGNSGTISLVSHAAGLPAQSANGESHVVAISADGRFVSFYSLATNLVTSQSDVNAVNDAFLWDRLTGTISLISHSAGTSVTTGSGESLPSSISADGSYVSFESAATNLLTPMTDTNGGNDAFLWDRLTGAVTLISHTASPTTTADGTSNPGLISADGNYVFIDSNSTNFPGITDANGAYDLFLWNRAADTLTLVSHTSGTATTTANKFSSGAQISADGRYVTYTSPATDLIAGLTDALTTSDIFVWDRTINSSTLISHASGSLTTTANASSFPRGMSADGGHVTLQSKATDLVAGVTDGNGLNDAFVWTRSSGAIALVSHAAGVPLTASNGESYPTAISDDGGVVLLQTTATNLGTGVSDANGTLDAYQWRAGSNASTLISHFAGVPLAAADDFSQPTLMSSDGQYAAFYSNALNLIGGGLDAAGLQIYRWAPSSYFYSLTPCRAWRLPAGRGPAGRQFGARTLHHRRMRRTDHRQGREREPHRGERGRHRHAPGLPRRRRRGYFDRPQLQRRTDSRQQRRSRNLVEHSGYDRPAAIVHGRRGRRYQRLLLNSATRLVSSPMACPHPHRRLQSLPHRACGAPVQRCLLPSAHH